MPIVTNVKQKKKQPIHKTLRHHAKHLLVPHKGNEYRPHLIRWTGLVGVVVVVLILQLSYGFMSTGKLEVLGRESHVTVSGLFDFTNQERVKDKLEPLTLSDQLNKAAFLKAQDMFVNNYWAHESPSGVTPWKWLADVDYSYDVAGENLAKNFVDASSTIDAWMASPTHRANILGDKYTQAGFAVAEGVLNGKSTTLVVAYYGLPVSVAVSAATTAKPQEQYVGNVNSGVGNPLTYFGSAIRALNPATLGTLGLLAIVAIVAAAAHHYRYMLPKRFKKSWKIHHGAYKLAGVGVAVVAIVVLTGGGQI